MSIQDERELRDRLGALLYGIEPGPAPVSWDRATGSGDQDAPVDLGGGWDCGARSRGSRIARRCCADTRQPRWRRRITRSL